MNYLNAIHYHNNLETGQPLLFTTRACVKKFGFLYKKKETSLSDVHHYYRIAADLLLEISVTQTISCWRFAVKCTRKKGKFILHELSNNAIVLPPQGMYTNDIALDRVLYRGNFLFLTLLSLMYKLKCKSKNTILTKIERIGLN